MIALKRKHASRLVVSCVWQMCLGTAHAHAHAFFFTVLPGCRALLLLLRLAGAVLSCYATHVQQVYPIMPQR